MKVKIVPVGTKEIQWQIMCPGCNEIHALSPKVHSFNGSFEMPSFSPSLFLNWNPGKVCHSYVECGKIEFLSDCYHALAGQTVELPEINH